MASTESELGAGKPSVEVAIAIIVDQNRILICRRKPEAVLGGYWEFPGGKIEPGETPEDAAVRESAEELGITVEPLQVLDRIAHVYAHARVTLYPIVCRLVAGEPQPLGCQELRWIQRDRLHDFTFPPANHSLLTQLSGYAL